MSKLYDRLKNASRERAQGGDAASRPPALLARALQRAQSERDRLDGQGESPELAAAGLPMPPSGDALAEPAAPAPRLKTGALALLAVVAGVGLLSYFAVTAGTPPSSLEDVRPDPLPREAQQPPPSPAENGPSRPDAGLRLDRGLDLSRKDGAARSSPPGRDRSR